MLVLIAYALADVLLWPYAACARYQGRLCGQQLPECQLQLLQGQWMFAFGALTQPHSFS